MFYIDHDLDGPILIAGSDHLKSQKLINLHHSDRDDMVALRLNTICTIEIICVIVRVYPQLYHIR